AATRHDSTARALRIARGTAGYWSFSLERTNLVRRAGFAEPRRAKSLHARAPIRKTPGCQATSKLYPATKPGRPAGLCAGKSLPFGSSGIEGDAFRVGLLSHGAFGPSQFASDGAGRRPLARQRLELRNILPRPLPSLCFLSYCHLRISGWKPVICNIFS